MRNHRKIGLWSLVLAATTIATLGSPTRASTPACAKQDLRLVNLIERHGEDQDVGGKKLFEAYLAVMAARKACAQGREGEALALYDSITLISVPARASR
jgi:hypothetical protein